DYTNRKPICSQMNLGSAMKFQKLFRGGLRPPLPAKLKNRRSETASKREIILAILLDQLDDAHGRIKCQLRKAAQHVRVPAVAGMYVATRERRNHIYQVRRRQQEGFGAIGRKALRVALQFAVSQWPLVGRYVGRAIGNQSANRFDEPRIAHRLLKDGAPTRFEHAMHF